MATVNSNQQPEKLKVWTGSYRDRVSFFVDGNLDGEKNLQLLIVQIVPSSQDVDDSDFN